MRAGQVMSAIVTLTTAVCIAFIYGWKLAIVLALAVPLIVGAGYQQQMSLRKHQRRDAKFMDEAGRVMTYLIMDELVSIFYRFRHRLTKIEIYIRNQNLKVILNSRFL